MKASVFVFALGRKRSTGFTLIELLVVIAIIGLLASLVLPALARARHASQSAICKSNLRQWGIGLRMYVDDFDVYPPYAMADLQQGVTNGSAPPEIQYWRQRLLRYTATKGKSWASRSYETTMPAGIDVCPSYARLRGLLTPGAVGAYGFNQAGVSMAKQELGLGGILLTELNMLPQNIRLVRENEVLHPSDMISIGDAMLRVAADWTDWRFIGLGQLGLSAPGMEEICIELQMGQWRQFAQDEMSAKGPIWIRRRHVGRWNMAFCDGHVESLRTRDAFDVRVDAVLKRWNRDNLPHRELISPGFR